MTHILPQWAVNELYIVGCVSKLIKAGYTVKAMGSTDSTVSDIAIYDPMGELVFFIESKSEKSQCGQFVLTVDSEGLFTATSGLDNPYTAHLVDALNRYVKTYPEDTKIDSAKLSETEKANVYAWIRNHYTKMGVKFIAVTDDANSYVNFIPLQDLEKEVNVTLKFPRIKQSGSANLPKSHKESFLKALQASNVASYDYTVLDEGSKTFIRIENRVLTLSEQYVDTDTYFLSKVSHINNTVMYAVKKRSTTRNVNEVLGFEYKGERKNKGFELLNTLLS